MATQSKGGRFENRDAFPLLKTLRIAKKHFDRSLERWFQPEINELCPQFCPHPHRVRERSRMVILAYSNMAVAGIQCVSVYWMSNIVAKGSSQIEPGSHQ